MPYIAHIFYKFSRGVFGNAPDKHKKEMKFKDLDTALKYVAEILVIKPKRKH